MFPDLFGIHGFTMNVLITIGILAGWAMVFFYLKKPVNNGAEHNHTAPLFTGFIAILLYACLPHTVASNTPRIDCLYAPRGLMRYV